MAYTTLKKLIEKLPAACDEAASLKAIKREVQRLQSEMEKETLPIPITAHALQHTNFPPVKWIVPGLIPTGLTILAGDAKIGKSFLCWNLAIAAASKGNALSHFPIGSMRNTLYLAMEDPAPLLQIRINDIMKLQSAPSNLFILDTFPALGVNGIETLRALIEEHAIEFIIIDTFQHIRPVGGQKTNAYEADYETLIPIQNLAHETDTAIVLVTHTRKAADFDNAFNKIQGSMGIQAGCDTLMMLVKEESQHLLKVIGRRILETEYAVALEDGIWRIIGEAGEVKEKGTRQLIIELLQDSNGMTATQIAKALDRKESTIRSTLRRLVEQDLIEKAKNKFTQFVEPEDDGIRL